MDTYREHVDFLICPFCNTNTIYYDTWVLANPYDDYPPILEYNGRIHCIKCDMSKIMVSEISEKNVVTRLISFWEKGMK